MAEDKQENIKQNISQNNRLWTWFNSKKYYFAPNVSKKFNGQEGHRTVRESKECNAWPNSWNNVSTSQ